MDLAPVPRSAWLPPSRARVRALRERLRATYGIPVMAPHGEPLAELVLTVLSQSTNDRNRDVAYLRLRERFPSWEAVRDAPVQEIEEAIQPGGLHVQKSRRLQAMLAALPDDLDLSWLATGPGGRGPRAAVLAARRGPQDGRVRPALLLRPARRARGHPRLAGGHAAGGCCGPEPRPASSTTPCSRRPRAARSSSCTSTSCATAGGRATPCGLPAPSARCGGCAPRGRSERKTLRFLTCLPRRHPRTDTRRHKTSWARPSASTSARPTRAWPSWRAASRPSSRTPRAVAPPRPSSPSRRAASASSARSPSARPSPTRRTRSSRSSASWAARRPRCARRSRSSPTRSSPARTATRA